MQEVHAVLLTGGSAFGLAAADGVMKYLEEEGIGYQTPWVKVPIVPAAVIFDLNIGSQSVRPGAAEGYQACKAAVRERISEGNVGAGTGASVGKWGGAESRMKGGLGFAAMSQGDLSVAAVAVVNAVGDVLDDRGSVLAGARGADGRWLAETDPLRTLSRPAPSALSNTTLVAIMTNAMLTKVEANRLSQRGHDGMARAIKPAHTSYDGDIVFALASGKVRVDFDLVAEIGAEVTAQAIRRGALMAKSVAGVPSCEPRAGAGG
jgi:L-aminopeptidase/D-esterase-like protein